jgi:Spy/CpxP family protein refolding chaperone
MSITNSKYTKWIIGALVLLNLILLSVLFFLRPQHERGERMKPNDFLKKELNLSDDQAVKFKELRKAHFQKSREERKAIRILKNEMLDAVSAESPDTLKANLIANQIGIKEANKEKLLVQHYLKLQAECTPEQRQKLERVFKRGMSQRKLRKGKREKKEAE